MSNSNDTSRARWNPAGLAEAAQSARCGLALLGATVLLLSCGPGAAANPGVIAGDVVVYERLSFDLDAGGFQATSGARAELTEDSVTGKALLLRPRRSWAGVQLPLGIEGSQGLRLAFLAKGVDYPAAELNVFDRQADDNTTSSSPRFLDPQTWTAALYSLDQFVYNSRRRTVVDAAAAYTSLRFFGPEKPTARSQMVIDNLVLYRGSDATPPESVTGLTAELGDDGVRLSWQQARDNVGPMGYVVSRRGRDQESFVKVAEASTPRWIDPSPPLGVIEYRILAFDFERNLGPWSEVLRVESGRPEGPTSSPTRSGPLLDRERLREIHARGVGRVRKGHVCLFGDSLTHARVYRRMAESALGVFTVAAHGFEGGRTDHGPRRIAGILDQENPEYLLVLLGTNNLRDRLVPGEAQLSAWMSDLEAVAKEAHRRGTIVLLGTVPPRGFDDPGSKPEAAYNAALQRLGSLSGVPVAPIFERLQAAGDRRKYLADDGIHWEPAAMEVAARAWAETLERVEWHLRDH